MHGRIMTSPGASTTTNRRRVADHMVARVLVVLAAATSAAVAPAQIINPRRGFGDVRANYTNLQAVGAGWYYTWGTGSASPGAFGAKHYPMFWSSPSDATIASVRHRPGVEWVLGFNEPDRPDQANMSVTTALDSWSRICDAFAGTSVKLAGPAISDNSTGRAWLADFMTQLEDRRTNVASAGYNPNLRVDAIAFHWYGSSSPSNPTEAANWFIGSVDYFRTTYGRGVMPTEFAIHDWGGAYTDQQVIDANKLFLDNVVPRLDSRSYVPAYAWYNWFSDSPLYAGSPPLPTPMAYRYVGAVTSGSTANVGGQDLGEYVAYLTGGTLTMTGTATGIVKYVAALANTSSLTGGMNWGLSGAGTWVRVEPDAVLRKTGTNRISFDGTRITNDGIIDVAGGTLRLAGGALVTGAGGMRVGPAGTLAIEPVAGIFTLDDPLELAGGTLEAPGGLRITGTTTLSGTATFAVAGTTTLTGPLVTGSGSGSLAKTGGGLLVVSTTAGGYAGPTMVSGGMLSVNGRLYATAITPGSAVVVSSGTLLAASFSELPTGSLGNLPATSDRVTLDGGTLRLAASESTSRGFTIGGGGALLDLQPGVNVALLESAAAARITSAGGALTLHATTGSGTLAKSYVGGGGLVKTGSGVWTLAGDNTFSGDTRVVAGTLCITGTASLAGSTLDLQAADAGGVTFATGSARTVSLGGLAGSRGLTLGAATLRVGGNGRSTTYAGDLTGAGGVVKTGSGTLTLGGSNSFSGTVAIEQGMLRLSGTSSLPETVTIRIASGAALAAPADTPLPAWLASGRIDAASSGAIVISGSLQAPLDLRSAPGLTVAGSGTAVLGGTLLPGSTGYRFGGGDGTLIVKADLASAPLVKLGNDVVTLAGTNVFAGGVRLAGGLLQAGSPQALGTAGTITFAGGGLQYSDATTADYSPRFSQEAGQEFRIDTAGRSVTFTSPLVSAGGSLVKLGSGTLTLASSNALDGTVRIAAGVLRLGGSTSLATTTLEFAAGDNGTLALGTAGQAVSLAGILGTRSLDIGGQTLRIGAVGRSTEFAGSISGSGGLVKEGSGTFTLSGSSPFTGTTTVAGGVLRLGAGGTAGSLAGPIVNQAMLVFEPGGGVTYAGTISGSGGITKRGNGTTTLAGTSSFTGGLRVELGTLQLAGSMSAAGRVTLVGGTFALAKIAGSQSFDGLAITAGDAAVSNTVGTGTLALGPLLREPGGVVRFVNRTGPITTSATMSSGILGAWAFTGSGTGTRYATLSGGTITAFTAGTVVNGMTAFGGIAAGDTATSSYDIASSGTFAAAAGDRIVNTIDYSGGGAVQQAVAAGSTLTANGIMTTGAGGLTLGGGSRLDLLVGSSRELVVNTVTADVVLSHGIFNHASGASGLTKAGTATLVINGQNGYTGRTTVAAGCLRFGSGGSGVVVPSTGFVIRGTLAFDHADTITLSGGLAGDGRVLKDGGGTLVVSGTGEFGGTVAVSAGTLMISGSGALGAGGAFAGTISLAAGSRFLHQASMPQTLTGVLSGSGSVTAAGRQLVLAATNTFTGGVTVTNGGGLVLANPEALGDPVSGGVLVLDGITATTVELATAGGGPGPLVRGNNGFASTLAIGRPWGTIGPGLTHRLAPGTRLSGGTLTVRAASSVSDDGAALDIPSLDLGAGVVSAITRLQPTTATITLGAVSATGIAVPKTLELSGSGVGNVVRGPISDGVATVSLVKSGAGTWTLDAANTFTGPAQLTGGTLRITHPEALAASDSVTIAGGRVTLPADVPLEAVFKGLSLSASSGLLDVGRGRVTIAAGGMAESDLRSALMDGFNAGGWNGGRGIVSTTVATEVAGGLPRAVGWVPRDDGSFTVGYAAIGDCTLDGFVDVLDAASFLGAGLFDAGRDAAWWQGDFNADGLVDILDAATFAGAAMFDSGGYADSKSGQAPPPAPVPEPAAGATLALLTVATFCGRLVSRLRRRISPSRRL